MTRPGTEQDDPLSGFPAEATVAGRAWRSRLPRVALVVAAGLLALVLAVLGSRSWRDAGTLPHDASVRIESTPPGARVSSSGRELGVTPLSLTLPAGAHRLTLDHGGVSRELALQLAPGTQAVHYVEMPVPPDANPTGSSGAGPERGAAMPAAAQAVSREPRSPEVGWLSVSSPVELQLFERESLVGSTRMERVMLPAGVHRLRLVNASLGFETESTVRVRPGDVSRTTVEVPDGAIFVNAIPWAEVLIDGVRVAETPIANHPLPLGSHDVVLRNPKFPEQRRRVTVTLLTPVRLGVDMRR